MKEGFFNKKLFSFIEHKPFAFCGLLYILCLLVVLTFIPKGNEFSMPDVDLSLGFLWFLKIVITNLIVVSVLIGGLFFWGVPSILGIITNSFMLGTFILFAVFNYDKGIEIVMKRFLPHSIEVFAILLAGSIGVQGIFLGTNAKSQFAILYKGKVKIFIVYLLIILSSVLEVCISGRI